MGMRIIVLLGLGLACGAQAQAPVARAADFPSEYAWDGFALAPASRVSAKMWKSCPSGRHLTRAPEGFICENNGAKVLTEPKPAQEYTLQQVLELHAGPPPAGFRFQALGPLPQLRIGADPREAVEPARYDPDSVIIPFKVLPLPAGAVPAATGASAPEASASAAPAATSASAPLPSASAPNALPSKGKAKPKVSSAPRKKSGAEQARR